MEGLPAGMSPKSLLLKVKPVDKQLQCDQQASEKYGVPGPSPGLQAQNLYFNRISVD